MKPKFVPKNHRNLICCLTCQNMLFSMCIMSKLQKSETKTALSHLIWLTSALTIVLVSKKNLYWIFYENASVTPLVSQSFKAKIITLFASIKYLIPDYKIMLGGSMTIQNNQTLHPVSNGLGAV